MKYYKVDSRKISFREYYNISRGSGWILAWLFKIVGIPLKLTSGIPEPQSFRDNIIEAGIIPPEILAKLNSGVLDLKRLGFDQFWFYTLKNSLIGGAAYGVQTLHPSHKTIGKVLFVSMKSSENFVFVFVSELNDGTFFGTTNNRPMFNSPLGYNILRRLHANAAQLLELQQNKLAELSQRNPPKTISNFDQVAGFEDKTSRMLHEDKVSRGIYIEMTDSEVEVLRVKLPQSR
jgi:hypothetical protein